MTRARFIQALIPAIVFAASGVAFAATHIDGTIPVYPNAVPRGFTWNLPKIDKALKLGSGMYLDSGDSVGTRRPIFIQQNSISSKSRLSVS